jgi:ketosteroid isomerase-like protein
MAAGARRPYGRGMTITTVSDADVVRSVFAAFAARDVPALHELFHPDATWNHRNQDRLGGIHRGLDGILAFIAQSAELTAGTLRPMPQAFMADGEGRVAVLVQVSGTRPDGRAFDNPQVVLFGLDEGRVRSVDQFVGDPAAVAAFWA